MNEVAKTYSTNKSGIRPAEVNIHILKYSYSYNTSQLYEIVNNIRKIEVIMEYILARNIYLAKVSLVYINY